MTDYRSQRDLEDELLSAYLDDELSPADLARVEERLAADPAARQMLDQLRAISQVVRDLPPAAVGEDLREPILRRAERSMLTSGGADHAGPPADSSPATLAINGQPSAATPVFSVGRTRRGWIWASLAAAAALLIIFLSEDELQDPQDVAVRQAPGPAAQVENRARDGAAGLAGDRPVLRATEPQSDSERVALSLREGESAAERDSSIRGPQISSGPSRAVSEPAQSLSGRGLSFDDDPAAGTALSLEQSQVAGTTGVAEAPPANGSSINARYGLDHDSGDGTQGLAAAPPAAPPQSAETLDQLSSSGGDVSHQLEGSTRAPGLGDAPATVAAPSIALAEQIADEQAEMPPSDEFVIVHMNVTADVLRRKSFDALLARNGIVLVDEAPAAMVVAEPAATSAADDRRAPSSLGGARAAPGVAGPAQSVPRAAGSVDELAKRELPPAEPEVDVVLVDAPAAQILTCLVDIDSDRENYLDVSVEDPATELDATQEPRDALNLGLTRYNRGYVAPDKKLRRGEDAWYYYGVGDRQMASGRGGGGGFGDGGGSADFFSGNLAEVQLHQAAEQATADSQQAATLQPGEGDPGGTSKLEVADGSPAADQSAVSLDARHDSADKPDAAPVEWDDLGNGRQGETSGRAWRVTSTPLDGANELDVANAPRGGRGTASRALQSSIAADRGAPRAQRRLGRMEPSAVPSRSRGQTPASATQAPAEATENLKVLFVLSAQQGVEADSGESAAQPEPSPPAGDRAE